MTGHRHYDYADAHHGHGGEYASDRHEHGYYDLSGVAEDHHRHHDLESEDEKLRGLITQWGEELRGLREELRGALERIRQLDPDEEKW